MHALFQRQELWILTIVSLHILGVGDCKNREGEAYIQFYYKVTKVCLNINMLCKSTIKNTEFVEKMRSGAENSKT
jgi:hypothetical protein